ncbi:GNAT family N-acetyltransferase [Clostridium thailandense]|uniref:GNAT family N-acetyltransferase n=1 Tax=Clostridium thailandense TaxID=2794346 RepID=UPI003988D18B
MIKKMTYSHIPEIQQIDKQCFKFDIPRRIEGIRGYINKCPNTAIVYELNNKIVGYNFMHIWGNFAWFGGFGVDPEYQGKGVGKELLSYTIKFLKEDMKLSNIGLYTMPESKYNVGLYMNMGFKPLKLSLGMVKEVNDFNTFFTSPEYEVTLVDISNELNYLNLRENIKILSDQISRGLDLSSQLHLIKYEGFGTAFALKQNGEFKGVVLCHTKHIREHSTSCLEIRLICLSQDVDYKKAIDSILDKCNSYVKEINYSSIFIDCNTYNYDICMHLLSTHGFKINKTQLTMIMDDEDYLNKYKGLVLCRWAG